MKYYFDPAVGVRAFEADGSQDFLITPEMRPLTSEELEAHLNPPVVPLTREQVEALRLAAYADPVTGSDRYFAEAARMNAMGESGADAVIAAGVGRYEEIQAEYPWP